MITDYLLKKALDSSLDLMKRTLIQWNSKTLTTTDKLEQSIRDHLRFVSNWSAEVSFRNSKSAKSTIRIFIELDLFLFPRKLRIDHNENIETIPVKKIFDYATNHVILLGLPGAGKTTSMKYLCQAILLEDDFYYDRFYFPIVVRFQDLNAPENKNGLRTIIDQIYSILGVEIELPKSLSEIEALSLGRDIREKVVINTLEELNVLLVLDGFDEIADLSTRQQALNDIRKLANHLSRSTIVVTSRTGDFEYHIENAVQYEICSLDKEQVIEFAGKWLIDPEKVSNLMAKIYNSPFADTAIRPLILAHLCAIYERVGDIPDKPKTVYRKIVNLLLEEWDQERSIRRYSRYADFAIDRKFEFLCQLAYILTTSLHKLSFSEFDLYTAYTKIYQDYGLVIHEGQQVVSELETHTGLILESGYRQFEFCHKSLQEYLTAEYLVKLPSIPVATELLLGIPNELAIAVAISSNPSEYFSELILNRLIEQNPPEAFVRPFLSRLILEKPDFNTNPRVGLACVFLYTIYIQSTLTNIDPFSIRDKTLKNFESIVKKAQFQTSTGFILQYYETKNRYDIEDGDQLLYMTKKDSNARLTKDPLLNVYLPPIVFIRNSFLQWHME